MGTPRDFVWVYLLTIARLVSEEEIRWDVFQLNPLKAPDPYGFSAGFYQKNWDIVGREVTAGIKHFFHAGCLLKKINHTFLT